MIALKYSLFATIATLINLSFQYVSFYFYSGFLSLYVALIIGTGSGLVSKYLLDKNFIFYHKAQHHTENIKNFIFYSFTGVFTTILFWSIEITFDFFVKFPNSKYVGGFIGLTLGYIIKYKLDKTFVFK